MALGGPVLDDFLGLTDGLFGVSRKFLTRRGEPRSGRADAATGTCFYLFRATTIASRLSSSAAAWAVRAIAKPLDEAHGNRVVDRIRI